jgi:hypothetical protein
MTKSIKSTKLAYVRNSLCMAIQNYLQASHAAVIRWPAIFVVAMDRVAENGGEEINDSRANFSEDLRLGPLYKLRGIIYHSDQNSRTGHCTAVAKWVSRESTDLPSHPELSDLTSEWMHFDDSQCCVVRTDFSFQNAPLDCCCSRLTSRINKILACLTWRSEGLLCRQCCLSG